MLHTVNKSPFEKNSLRTCFRLAEAGSDVLLLEDAVYAAQRGTAFEEEVSRMLERMSIYVLGPDLEARGLTPGSLIPGLELIDYDGFVDLAVSNDSVQNWL